MSKFRILYSSLAKTYKVEERWWFLFIPLWYRMQTRMKLIDGTVLLGYEDVEFDKMMRELLTVNQ